MQMLITQQFATYVHSLYNVYVYIYSCHRVSSLCTTHKYSKIEDDKLGNNGVTIMQSTLERCARSYCSHTRCSACTQYYKWSFCSNSTDTWSSALLSKGHCC